MPLSIGLKEIAMKALLYLKEIQSFDESFGELAKAWSRNLSFYLLCVLKPSFEGHYLNQAVAEGVAQLDQVKKHLIQQG
jgi:hypothetical protein